MTTSPSLRRTGLSALTLALALLLALSSSATALAQSRNADWRATRLVPDSKISIQLWTLRDVMDDDPAGTLQAVADIGYRNVEPFSFHGLSAEEFAQALDDAGLKAPTLHTNIDALRFDLDQVIADAKAIGARQVSLAWVGDEWRTPEGIAELAEILDEVGAELRRNGLQLGYHNHDFEFTSEIDGMTMFDYLIANTERQNVDFQLDLYWVEAAGVDAATVIADNRRRITTVHVKDMDEDGSFANFGEGVLDFQPMFRASTFRYYIIENDQPGDDPLAAAKIAYDNLRAYRY